MGYHSGEHATGSAADPFEATYSLTNKGQHAAEYGEYEYEFRRPETVVAASEGAREVTVRPPVTGMSHERDPVRPRDGELRPPSGTERAGGGFSFDLNPPQLLHIFNLQSQFNIHKRVLFDER